MTYGVEFHPKVLSDDIPKLSKTVLLQIKKATEERLTQHPETFGKPLRQSLRGYRTLRVGDYRIVFRVQSKTVKVLAVRHRQNVYDIVGKRV